VEILRSAGLEDAVQRKSQEQYPPDGGVNNVESLAGREIANYFPNLNAGVEEFSPTVRLFINQDALEPILRARASELGARLRYRAECTSLVQDAAGVTAVVRDLESGTESSVRTKYVFDRGGTRLSTLDLFGRNFVLLAGPEGAAWPAAALAVADRLGVGLDAHVVGEPGWPTRRAASPGRTGSRRPEPCWCDRTASWAGGPLKRPAHPNRLSGRRSRRCCAGDMAGHELRVRKRKKVHSWHMCIARTRWARCCARRT
jgi:FAD binding domain